MHGTRLRQRKAVPSITSRRGATFVELLLVLAIYTLLMSLLLPAAGLMRSRGMSAKCLANLREIGACTSLYFHAQQDRKLIPWYQRPPHPGYNFNVTTPWVFGGFKAPNPDPDDGGYIMDSELYPAEIRPLNKFVARQARGDITIDLYVCPADRSNSTAIIGQSWVGEDEESRSSWEANGTSYSLNARFMQGYSLPSGNYGGGDYAEHAERISGHMIAGEASKFIMWVEHGFYSATYNAGPTIAGISFGALPPRSGWHREFSNWAVGFADGHARYGYYDTRTIFGLGGTIWQPNFQHGL